MSPRFCLPDTVRCRLTAASSSLSGYDSQMPIERVESLDDPRLIDYRHVPDPELLRRGEVFVAEGRLVVRTLLASSPLGTRSVLLTENAYRALADVIEPRLAGIAVFLVEQGTIEALTGFNIHRGCLAIGERPSRATVADLLTRLPTARRLVVLERIANADNMGGIFRNAAAFGADAVVLGPGCCDPLYRKAIRVSMGAALRLPFGHADDWEADLERLRAEGLTVAALVADEGADDLGRFASALPRGGRLAVVAGSEGFGLTAAALAHADVALRIPMAPGVDSLNVATATGIALHRVFSLGLGYHG
jgi:tRNA G18 (ribose-2'-O)-methylase SpoU